jgi:prevent-host-death family protein
MTQSSLTADTNTCSTTKIACSSGRRALAAVGFKEAARVAETQVRRYNWLTISSERLTMKEVAVYEAKTRLSELLAEVEKGEQFVITRRGEAIARLVSAAPAVAKRSQALAQRQRVANVFDDLKRLRAGTTLGMPLRQAIEHGRD